ncbi:MAG: hypothetical protein J3Q66DRAFT_330223 [Benniella sp.]|nr:MAG: hypothetical protein J3Q66DRAFT_330223 [Benniella sp.]
MSSPAAGYRPGNASNNPLAPTFNDTNSRSNFNDNTHDNHSNTSYIMQQRQHHQAVDSLRQHLQPDGLRPTSPPAGPDSLNTTESAPKPPGYCYPPPQQPSHSRNASSDKVEQGFKSRVMALFNFPSSMYGKGMILVIAVEALLVIIMQAVIVGLYLKSLVTTPLEPMIIDDQKNVAMSFAPYQDPRNPSRSIPAYMIVFVFAQLFQLVFAWDAVRAQNTIELISIVFFNLCCFAYSVFEISQSQRSLDQAAAKLFFDKDLQVSQDKAVKLQGDIVPFLRVVVAVIGVTQCIVIWLAYQLFQEFGWKIYKKIGADPKIKRMFRFYQVYLVLIKVDFFFFVGFSIQFIYLTLTKGSEDPEYWLTIIVLPLTIVILYIAVYAVRHESRKWMATFFLAMFCGIVYFIFKVIRMYRGPKVRNYEGVNKFLTLFASLCMLTILLTFANATICYRNFGKGLKPHLNREAQGFQNTTTAANERVIEID